MAVLQWRFK